MFQPSATTPPTRILYLAHDLDDSAIWRRVTMLEHGGAEVTIMGFRRGDGPLPRSAVTLGRTRNARMQQRAAAVLRAMPGMARRAGPAPDVILARNLEMLMLGAMVLRGQRRGERRARLVYELLDIHAMMLGDGRVSRVLRRIEAALLRRSAAIIVSSPGFVTHYLDARDRPDLPVHLVENKPLDLASGLDVAPARVTPAEAGRLTIGWFGILRCRWSLATLDAITRAAPGRYRVVLRGRPALDVVPDFHAVVAGNPDLDYGGPYAWPDDLAGIYGDVDLAWMIDRYQSGQNSDWLLPNRLYEGGLHGAVPVALAGTQVAAKLAEMGIGLTVPAPEQAGAALASLDPGRLAELRAAVAAIPTGAWVADAAECRALVAALAGEEAA